MSEKLFDYAIGNPPYNEDFSNSGDNGNFAKPVYHEFMDAANDVSEKVELIHPARFLFNAGSTPKEWNQKMLNDPHFKVLDYSAESDSYFPSLSTGIKGGVAITYHDDTRDFGAIGTFTPYPKLTSIVAKSAAKDAARSIASIVYTQVRFDLDALYADHPECKKLIGSDGKDRRFRNNTFEKIPVFAEKSDGSSDIHVVGVVNKNQRVWRYISRKYVDMTHENIGKWKVLISRANGKGLFGEKLGEPFVLGPNEGYTQTFIGIGTCDSKETAENIRKYVKTRFARTLLSLHKVTQDNDRGVWVSIPLQNFGKDSDINWSGSVADIDRQLYKKYNFSSEEIEFIESHTEGMN